MLPLKNTGLNIVRVFSFGHTNKMKEMISG